MFEEYEKFDKNAKNAFLLKYDDDKDNKTSKEEIKDAVFDKLKQLKIL